MNAAPARAIPLLALVAPIAACGAASENVGAQTISSPTIEEWSRARALLSALRKEARRPRTERISLRLREPLTGRVLEARGAAAVDPPRALRMILIGPGGATALDLWIDGDRYRFAVPALDLVARGDAGTPREARRGLPVDFLRFWLLRPAEGSLLFHARDPGASSDRFVLRDGDAVVDLRAFDDGRIEARRTSWSRPLRGARARLIDDETVAASSIGCGSVRYRQASTGLEVTVRCEGEETSPPNPRAFADPDAEGAR